MGLKRASKPLVLFLDDDILAAPGFVAAHAAAHNRDERWIVVGQIIQPWQQPADVTPPSASPTQSKPTSISRFIRANRVHYAM